MYSNYNRKLSLADAIYNENLDLVKEVVKNGTDINEKDRFGDSPLNNAAEMGLPDIALWLIDNGANINETNNCGRTPLMRAAALNKKSIASALLEKGADLDRMDTEGRTALMMTVANFNATDVTSMLIEKGAKLDLTDKEGKTALMLAVEYGRKDNVVMLLDAGADQDLKDKSGKTALDMATYHELKNLLTKPTEKWQKMDDHMLAHIGTYPPLERKITSIFNFKSRERFIITENTNTGAEMLTPPTSFDNLPATFVMEACEQAKRLSMGIDEDFAMRGTNRLAKLNTGIRRAG